MKYIERYEYDADKRILQTNKKGQKTEESATRTQTKKCRPKVLQKSKQILFRFGPNRVKLIEWCCFIGLLRYFASNGNMLRHHLDRNV